MRRRVVLDASAAVHIVCRFPAAAKLLGLLGDTALVLAPDLYSGEVASALWKYVTHESLPKEEASQRLSEARALVDLQVPTDDLVEEALVAAITYGHPVYDMLYAVLARQHGATVLTMDRRLTTALRKMEVDFLLESSEAKPG